MLALRYLARDFSIQFREVSTLNHMRKITGYAKENRKNPTKAEAKLKSLLLSWKIRFRSQRQFDYFIVDFLIPHKRLVIEVDGEYHLGRQEYDRRRERHLENLGLNVIRVSNQEVLAGKCEELRKRIESYPDHDIRAMDFREVYGQAKY